MFVEQKIIAEEQQKQNTSDILARTDTSLLENQILKLRQKKEYAYDDYLDQLITKNEYVQYKEKYDQKIVSLENQIKALSNTGKAEKSAGNQWVKHLSETGRIDQLDRETVLEMVHMIYIFDDYHIQIIYNFADAMEEM